MIYVVRHGETDWNLFKRCNGITETFLNQTGINQAIELEKELRDVQFERCFCSPQIRARQFCEIIYKGEICYDERLKEIQCGEFEGLEETKEMMEKFWQAVQTGDKGTEKFQAFINRNLDLCEQIQREYRNKNILMVTHAANLRVIDYFFAGKKKDYDFLKRVIDKGEFITYPN